ncbi:MAG TPA: tetratricopeptide repeat protein [Candidatus Limnocylindrales bacterium]|nr:tetratricopeptide repeat protein [Candidatus Limnocylindrales bacterium]
MTTETQLDTLEAKGLIRLAASVPELEYLFRHWLVQDAAYGSLLKQERKVLHGQVGAALEALYPDRRDELAAVLGMHFEEAGDDEKAIGYLTAAGRYAVDRNAIQEAFSAYDRAAALLPPATPQDDLATRRRRIEVQLGRSKASWTFRNVNEVITDLEAVANDAEELGDLQLIAEIHLLLALSRLQTGDMAADPAVQRSLQRVTEIGEQLGDTSLRALPLALAGLMQVYTGPVRAGVEALEEAVPLMEGHKDMIGAAFARGSLAMGYATLGEFDKAEIASANATELAKSADLIAQLDAQIAESMLRSARGQVDQAIPIAQACISRAAETGASACVMASSFVLGDLLHREGRFAEAKVALKRGRDLSLVVDRMAWRPTLVAWLGGATAALGETPEDQWDEVLATTRMIHNTMGEAGILAKRAEAAARRGDMAAAQPDFVAAVKILEAEGARPSLARVLRVWGEALRAAGRTDEAEARLRRSLALFEELGIPGEAGVVRTLLSLGDTSIAFGS